MNVCYKCIGDDYLSREIRAEGKRAKCEFCDKLRKSYTVDEVAERVRDAIDAHYKSARNEYGEGDGQPIADLIAELLESSEDVSEAVRERISDDTSWEANDGGYEDTFGRFAEYLQKPADTYDFQTTWGFFRSEIRTRSRYFSETAKRALQDIFGDLSGLKTWRGEPVIRMVGPGTQETHAYRARIAGSEAELKAILESPTKDLGPPPPNLARAGRMNAKGIAVFYGAMEKDTCLAEARAPVGSHVVIGRFEFTRELRLLDLAKLTGIYTSASIFDPQYSTLTSRAGFFHHLVAQISRPIMPRDEEDEYLVTQAVAEFLAASTNPPLDGILFDSAQTDGEGHNLVLFHDASGVEPYVLPLGTTVEVNLGWEAEDDHDDSISVWETTPRPAIKPIKPKPAPAPDDGFPNFESLIVDPINYETEFTTPPEPSLRLIVDELEVRRVQAVKYTAPTRSLHRYRHEEGFDEDFGPVATYVYFAYGSNMASARLRFRVSGCRVRGVATLVGHELRFHKVSQDGSAKCDAFATGDPSTSVVGVLYDVPRSQKNDLDKAEGLGHGYDDAMVNVVSSDGSIVEAITYIASSTAINATLKPYTWYRDFVVDGATEHKLPEAYLAKYVQPVAAIVDPDPEREKKQRSEVTARPKFDLYALLRDVRGRRDEVEGKLVTTTG